MLFEKEKVVQYLFYFQRSPLFLPFRSSHWPFGPLLPSTATFVIDFLLKHRILQLCVKIFILDNEFLIFQDILSQVSLIDLNKTKIKHLDFCHLIIFLSLFAFSYHSSIISCTRAETNASFFLSLLCTLELVLLYLCHLPFRVFYGYFGFGGSDPIKLKNKYNLLFNQKCSKYYTPFAI